VLSWILYGDTISFCLSSWNIAKINKAKKKRFFGSIAFLRRGYKGYSVPEMVRNSARFINHSNLSESFELNLLPPSFGWGQLKKEKNFLMYIREFFSLGFFENK